MSRLAGSKNLIISYLLSVGCVNENVQSVKVIEWNAIEDTGKQFETYTVREGRTYILIIRAGRRESTELAKSGRRDQGSSVQLSKH